MALRLLSALTGWEPRTALGAASGGIVPAAPFVLCCFVAVLLAARERLDRRNP